MKYDKIMRNQLTKSELSDRIEMLEDAHYHLKEAITLITDALYQTDEQDHAESYIIPHLHSWLEGKGYNSGIPQYMEALLEAREEAPNE